MRFRVAARSSSLLLNTLALVTLTAPRLEASAIADSTRSPEVSPNLKDPEQEPHPQFSVTPGHELEFFPSFTFPVPSSPEPLTPNQKREILSPFRTTPDPERAIRLPQHVSPDIAPGTFPKLPTAPNAVPAH